MLPDSPYVDRILESPNGRERLPEEQLRLVVLHGTAMPTDDGALERLCDPVAEVSCHYYITREGEVVQLVPEARAAWHAGKSGWAGHEGVSVNGISLGIEIGNGGDGTGELAPPVGGVEPYHDVQYGTLIELLRDILHRYPEVVIVGHHQVSPGRKTDPWPHFEWGRLRAAGLPVSADVFSGTL